MSLTRKRIIYDRDGRTPYMYRWHLIFREKEDHLERNVRVPFNVYLHKIVLSDEHRFLTLVCGRRWGKDHLACIKILSHSLSHKSPRGGKIYAWLNPVYNPQGKESFRVMRQFAESGGLISKCIETPPMEIRFTNGDKVVFFSAD